MVYFIQGATYWPSDWMVHLGLRPVANYPPLAPYLTTFAFQHGGIIIYSIAVFLFIPYILLRIITKNDLIPLFYIYLSGVPWTLTWGGFFAQGLAHILILLNFFTPILWPLTLAIGIPIHREIIGAWGLSVVVATYYKVFYHGAKS